MVKHVVSRKQQQVMCQVCVQYVSCASDRVRPPLWLVGVPYHPLIQRQLNPRRLLTLCSLEKSALLHALCNGARTKATSPCAIRSASVGNYLYGGLFMGM